MWETVKAYKRLKIISTVYCIVFCCRYDFLLQLCGEIKITKNARLVTHTHNHERKKYEEFGGRPPVGGRSGAQTPWAPLLNPALL